MLPCCEDGISLRFRSTPAGRRRLCSSEKAMKKLILTVVGCAVLVGFSAAPAFALPVFKKEFDAYYHVDNPETDAQKALAASVAEAKCNVCHKGKSKKDRNPYGEELSKYLKKDDFKKDRLDAEPEKCKAEMIEAFKKAAEGKAADGKTFGELIEAGKLPAPTE